MAVVIGLPAVPNSFPKETSVAPLQERTARCPMSSVDPLSLPSGSVQCRLISPEILASTLRPVPMWLLLFPSLADNSFYTWQHGSSTISDIGDAYKNKPGTTHLGHDTVIAMEILPLQILQKLAPRMLFSKENPELVDHLFLCAKGK
ncbi:uncharacterized protein LOC144113174 [Amblyomma americanum]